MPDGNPRVGAGDVEIDLDGETVVLRPSLQAAQRLSRQSGGLAQAIQRVGNLDIDAISEVVTAGTGAEGRAAGDIPEKVWNNGLLPLVAPCIRYLHILSNRGQPPSSGGEDDAENPTKVAGS